MYAHGHEHVYLRCVNARGCVHEHVHGCGGGNARERAPDPRVSVHGCVRGRVYMKVPKVS